MVRLYIYYGDSTFFPIFAPRKPKHNQILMKKLFFLLAGLFIIITSCTNTQAVESLLPTDSIDLAGNAFQAFKLNGDVKLLATPTPNNSSKYTIKATAPLQAAATVSGPVKLQLTLLDENGINIGDGFILEAEDMENIIPVLNASPEAEKTVVFSVVGNTKEYSQKEASELISKVKKIRMTVLTEEPVVPIDTTAMAAEEESQLTTLNDLLKEYNVYNLLAQYDYWLKKDDDDRAEKIEDKLYAITKKVQNDKTIPESLRDKFEEYIEDREDEIEDKY